MKINLKVYKIKIKYKGDRLEQDIIRLFLVFNATFNNIAAVSFIGGGNRSARRKQMTDKLYHIMSRDCF
jgi:hypothetical protein